MKFSTNKIIVRSVVIALITGFVSLGFVSVMTMDHSAMQHDCAVASIEGITCSHSSTPANTCLQLHVGLFQNLSNAQPQTQIMALLALVILAIINIFLSPRQSAGLNFQRLHVGLRQFLRERNGKLFERFCYWLQLLEKRDPLLASIAV